MDKYSITCSCGHEMSVEADTREEAVSKMKEEWNEDAVATHMADNHKGEPPMSVAQAHAQIEQNLKVAAS